MKLVRNNTEKENYFKTSWANFLQGLSGHGGKLPEVVGSGFLAGLAAKNDLCIAVYYEDDLYSVCGRPANSASPYYCEICYRALKKGVESVPKPKPLPELEELPF